MEKIHEMVTKCIEVLDPTVKVSFRNNPIGVSILKYREIILPDWDDDLYNLLVIAFHELAHILFSTKISSSKLSDEEEIALRSIDEAYVNYRFCERYPEFKIAFNNHYHIYQQENLEFAVIGDRNFWADFEYALWNIGVSHGLATPLCKELAKKGLIDEIQEDICSAKSTKDLIPVAKKLVLEIQKMEKFDFPNRGMKHPLEVEKFDLPEH